MHKVVSTIIVASALALSLSSCLQLPSASTNNPPAADPSFAPQPTEDAETDDKNAAFGDAVTYIDGVSISVSEPAEFTPSASAAGADQAHNLVFNLTITNGSEENLEPSVFSTVSSAGTEASSIFDFEAGLQGGPTTVILPGGTISWQEGYSVADPANIVFQTSPSFAYDSSIFTNAG